MKPLQLSPSQRIRVVQTISTRSPGWATGIEGTVVEMSAQPTGSWFAHGKNDRLWLQRLRLAKDDGEIVDLVLDDTSVVTII